MTIKNLYPKSRPATIYNVINGRPELPAASAFSRASTGTYVDGSGIIRVAAAGEPRFNYDPLTGEFLGLLLEPTSTNAYQFWSSPAGQMQGFQGSRYEDYTTTLPDGTTGTCKRCYISQDPNDLVYGTLRCNPAPGFVPNNDLWTASWYIKAVPGSSSVPYMAVNVGNRGTENRYFTDEWTRISITSLVPSDNVGAVFGDLVLNDASRQQEFLIWGFQLEQQPQMTSYILSTTSKIREADTFSLTTSTNFDSGYSLLLDSETTTQDFLYRIKASGTTISELKNNRGTLEWDINGTSAQSAGLYPQVGFTNGRVRTVSSYGAADGTVQQNYLYTTGLSFPTPAVVASGADELEFGVPQTLKALYLWNGQLSDTEAVSIIKGEYNVVPNEPIKGDSYSFVYNTDPTDVGEATIDLPYIVPTISMRIYWGDGTTDRLEKAANGTLPLPQHTYPYPGQYRIQITADDGYDSVRLADVDNTITRVDQWAPQHRVGATGAGFTGNDLAFMFYAQANLTSTIPDFKYSELTSLQNTFFGVTQMPLNNWSWVPWNIPEVVYLINSFKSAGYYSASASEYTTFPQLVTGPALISVEECFHNTGLSGFVDRTNGDSPTNKPFTNTSNVINFARAFYNCNLTSIDLDTSAATSLEAIFYNNNFVSFPVIDTSNVTNFSSAWQSCKSLTSFPLIDTSSGTNLANAWSGCGQLTNFPAIDISNATNISEAWYACNTLTTFPALDYSSVTNFNIAWTSCTSLATFSPSLGSTSLDLPQSTSLYYAWKGCSKLTSFPSRLNAPKCTNVSYIFYANTELTSIPSGADWNVGTDPSVTEMSFISAFAVCEKLVMPLINMDKCTDASSAFSYMYANTSFPAIGFPICRDFGAAWRNSTNLASFPANMFDTTGTLESDAFSNAFINCALTAQSIENILVSLDTNGQSNIELGIEGGSNAAKSTWTAAANTAYTNLIGKGWTITFTP